MQLHENDVLGGRFRLERLLGEGGMGMVWCAEDLGTHERVALKFLRGQAASESARRRFFREARAAMAVQHPNVVRVHEVLTAPDGSPLMVMDFLEGESLGARLEKKKKLALDECAELLLPVVSAIGTANAKGIVHRDLKPDNIFIVTGAREDARVLDFGIAKLTAQEGEAMATANLTSTNAMLGTPYYMSPEQVFSDKTIDHRSDVWSLGVILYECLSGQRPLVADNIGALLHSITTGRMKPLRELEPALPPDVLDLVDRMLSRDRDARPSDLREVYDVLAPYTTASRRPLPFGAATMDAQIALDETQPGAPLSLTSTSDALVRSQSGERARKVPTIAYVAGALVLGAGVAGGAALLRSGAAAGSAGPPQATSAPAAVASASAIPIVTSTAPAATSAPSVAPSALAAASGAPGRAKPKASAQPQPSASASASAAPSATGPKFYSGNPY